MKSITTNTISKAAILALALSVVPAVACYEEVMVDNGEGGYTIIYVPCSNHHSVFTEGINQVQAFEEWGNLFLSRFGRRDVLGKIGGGNTSEGCSKLGSTFRSERLEIFYYMEVLSL